MIETSIRRMFYQSKDRIDPMQSVFERKRILITDLLPPIGRSIVGKSFTDCEIVGPANVV